MIMKSSWFSLIQDGKIIVFEYEFTVEMTLNVTSFLFFNPTLLDEKLHFSSGTAASQSTKCFPFKTLPHFVSSHFLSFTLPGHLDAISILREIRINMHFI